MHKEKETFTYSDYLTWPDDERWEIIDGVAYAMSPSPREAHQRISMRLSGILESALEGKTCVPYAAPFDVVFSEKDVVQPDVFVICDRKKITDDNIQGAPDLIIEILSPSTSEKDQTVKKELYERNGVKEYLIFDPVCQCVNRYLLGENGKYLSPEYFNAQKELPLISLPGLSLPLWKIFGLEIPQDKTL